MKRYVRYNGTLIDTKKSNKIYFDYGYDIARYWLRVNKGAEREIKKEEFEQNDSAIQLLAFGDMIENKSGDILPFGRWDYHKDDKPNEPSWVQIIVPSHIVPVTRWYSDEIVAVWFKHGRRMSRYQVK